MRRRHVPRATKLRDHLALSRDQVTSPLLEVHRNRPEIPGFDPIGILTARRRSEAGLEIGEGTQPRVPARSRGDVPVLRQSRGSHRRRR